MIFAFYAFALGDLGWRDDLYYGAIRLSAALTVCHFLSDQSPSVCLRLQHKEAPFGQVLYLIRFLNLNA